MKKTTKKVGLRAETLRNLAQHEIRDLADHELNVVTGGSFWFNWRSNHSA